MIGQTQMLEFGDLSGHWKAKDLDLSPILHSFPSRARHVRPVQRRAAGPRARAVDRPDEPAVARQAGDRRRRAGLPRAADPEHQPHGRHHALGRGGQAVRVRRPAGRHDHVQVHRLGRAEPRARSSPAASRCCSRATPTTTSARGARAAASRSSRRGRRRSRRARTSSPATRSATGAIDGELYIRGVVGERFCVRNSGASRGRRGRRGPRVRVHDRRPRRRDRPDRPQLRRRHERRHRVRLRRQRAVPRALQPGHGQPRRPSEPEDLETLRRLLENHAKLTGSPQAKAILDDWDRERYFVKVIPNEYSASSPTAPPSRPAPRPCRSRQGGEEVEALAEKLVAAGLKKGGSDAGEGAARRRPTGGEAALFDEEDGGAP